MKEFVSYLFNDETPKAMPNKYDRSFPLYMILAFEKSAWDKPILTLAGHMKSWPR